MCAPRSTAGGAGGGAKSTRSSPWIAGVRVRVATRRPISRPAPATSPCNQASTTEHATQRRYDTGDATYERRRDAMIGCMAGLDRSAGAGRPAIYPFPWPQLARISNLKGLPRHSTAAPRRGGSRTPRTRSSPANNSAPRSSSLFDRFRLEELVLGETTIDPEVGQERVRVTDPRMLGPGESSRVITVDQFNAVIPVFGDTELLAFWPPDVRATEPTLCTGVARPADAVHPDPRTRRAERPLWGGRATLPPGARHQCSQACHRYQRNCRRVDADLPELIRELVTRQKRRLDDRTHLSGTVSASRSRRLRLGQSRTVCHANVGHRDHRWCLKKATTVAHRRLSR